MGGFAKSAILLFLALRAGDLVSLAAGLWFVPRYVSPDDIGAVLPVTSFATFLALPLFAFAMAVMRESAALAAQDARGKIKSLLAGVFAGAGVLLLVVLVLASVLVPRFLGAMRVSEASVGFLVVAAAFLGCFAPVYTDALQSLKRFRALAAIEFGGALARFLTLLAVMPFRALAGYFAGQAALPAFRAVGSIVALRRELSVPAESYWCRAAVRRLAAAFLAIAVYQAAPMAASLVEQSLLRTTLSAEDSAAYFLLTRFSDILCTLAFPLLLVMFPYTAAAAERREPTRPFVLKCAATTLVAAALLAAVYAVCGRELLALVPHGEDYADFAYAMPWLVAVAALTTCQVFYTNAEVSAGRYAFLLWLVPLHVVYPVLLRFAVSCGYVASFDGFLACFAAASALRFAFAAGFDSALAICKRGMV